jgi:hypothetical protein
LKIHVIEIPEAFPTTSSSVAGQQILMNAGKYLTASKMPTVSTKGAP